MEDTGKQEMNRHTRLHMKEWYGWKRTVLDSVTLWFKGYLLEGSIAELHQQAIVFAGSDDIEIEKLANWANCIRGHFAIMIETPKWVFGAVDKDRSIPIFYVERKLRPSVGNHAPMLKELAGLKESDLNQQAVIEMAMSGYTIGRKTLYKGLYQLMAGDCIFIDTDYSVRVKSYYVYSPWKTRDRSEKILRKELTEVTKSIIEDMAKGIKGRQIIIPLSAGNDSRLIASGLKEIGVKDVYCFSYGLPGNFEAKAAKEIAERLNYKWSFIPLSIAGQKRSFRESAFEEYWRLSDTLSNTPILIDYSAIKEFCRKNDVSNDAVFVNGNSGDFITGGHIGTYIPDGAGNNIDSTLRVFVEKHYSLWGHLKTETNINELLTTLKLIAKELIEGYSLSEEYNWAVAENLEWSGRQTKWVSATQRSYEFHGHEWRLPLWDPRFMEFWEGVPMKQKLDQKLYKETLTGNNWGNVWGNIKVNDKEISPASLRIARLLMKASFLLLGKERWKKMK